MRPIRYSVHFLALFVSALILWLAKDVHLPYWVADFDFFSFGLMGVLYAASIVVSLRDRKANHLVVLCFIALAAGWSAATPILGLWGSIVWTPLMEIVPRRFGLAFPFLTGSAIGAAGYWLLVRLFWLKSLRGADCVRTVVLCVAATLLSYAVMEALPQSVDRHIRFLLPTVAWWCAFSISLYWSEVSAHAKGSVEEMVSLQD